MALINSKKPPDGYDDDDEDDDDEDRGLTDAQSDLLDPAANFNPDAVAVAVAKVPLMNKHKYTRPPARNPLLSPFLSFPLFPHLPLYLLLSLTFPLSLSVSLSHFAKPPRQTVNIFLLTAHTLTCIYFCCVCVGFLWSGDKLRELSISAKCCMRHEGRRQGQRTKCNILIASVFYF